MDAFVSRGCLEHVPDPGDIVANLARATALGGLAIHQMPFLYPFHASPDDFQRFTHKGARTLFKGCEVLRQANCQGPFSLAVICLAELASIMLGFGRPRLRSWAYMTMCLLLFPVKFLDWPFVDRPAFMTLAPNIITVARKDAPA